MGTVRQRLGEKVTEHREQVGPPEGPRVGLGPGSSRASGIGDRTLLQALQLITGPTRPQRAVRGTLMLPVLGEEACPGVPGRA